MGCAINVYFSFKYILFKSRSPSRILDFFPYVKELDQIICTTFTWARFWTEFVNSQSDLDVEEMQDLELHTSRATSQGVFLL